MDYDPNPAQAAIINAILKKHVNNLIKKQTVDEFVVKKVDPVEK